MKTTKLLTIVCLLCLTSVLIAPATLPVTASSGTTATSKVASSISSASPVPPLASRTVRVAIYDEPNTTAPAYATDPGARHNNASGLATVLQALGFTVTLLNVRDISSHQLQTARYDVLALVDNFPRENITDLVREFWLGGGGLLAFDGSAGFLCYFGILPPEAAGTSGSPAYWDYSSNEINITTRHPVSKSFSVGQTLNDPTSGYLRWVWSALAASTIAGQLTRVARSNDALDTAAVLAFDPKNRGGKIVTIGHDFYNTGMPGLNQLIADALDWLCPRPKGRIVFDLSHEAHYGIDAWDTLTDFHPRLSQWRDVLVNHSYMVDKLYPSASGNLTAARLAPYDLLVVLLPHKNFTVAERTAVTAWISGGGSLFALGDNPSLATSNGYINFLLSSFGLRMINTYCSSDTIDHFVTHPTTEGCTALQIGTGGLVNYTGSAYRIWGPDTINTVAAGQTYGAGRVILVSDINWPCNPTLNYLDQADNRQYAINVADWLTASKADVLLYVDEPYSPNYYKTPVCLALNDLGVSYALTFTSSYFNLSLNLYPWALVIVDNPWYNVQSYYGEISQYLDAGGRLLFSGYEVDNLPSSPLWAKLGFAYAAAMPDSVPVYIWTPSHDIFAQPNHYAPGNFTPTIDYGDEGDLLTVFANATALAGSTVTTTSDKAVIVARNDGKSLYNGYLIDQFANDLDDSTYQDRLELWENEIAYMLRPACSLTPNVPASVTQGTTVSISVQVTNLGARAASGGHVTLTVPAGLGTLSTTGTQAFATPLGPGASDTVTWQLQVTGTGTYTLTFTADYGGLWGTSYSVPALPAGTSASAPIPPPIPWLPIPIVGIIAVGVVLLGALLKRKHSPA